jgi:hypothetical protein
MRDRGALTSPRLLPTIQTSERSFHGMKKLLVMKIRAAVPLSIPFTELPYSTGHRRRLPTVSSRLVLVAI